MMTEENRRWRLTTAMGPRLMDTKARSMSAALRCLKRASSQRFLEEKMEAPPGLRYSKEHEWVAAEETVATVGITDHAQEQLGEIVYIE